MADARPYTREELDGIEVHQLSPDGTGRWFDRVAIPKADYLRLRDTARVGLDDTERMDRLEAAGLGRGWQVLLPTPSGWALRITPRGPCATLRQAIDKAFPAPPPAAPTSPPEDQP